MSTRPIIFISSVSKELSSTRKLVAETLYTLGYDPKSEDNAATDAGEIPDILRQWIDQSDSVIQLVGHCYGLPLAQPHPQFGPCSHTQYEAHYAHQKGKKVYFILLDPVHPTDGCACQPQALHDLQEQYRQTLKSNPKLFHHTSSLTQTELLVRRLKDDLAHLRKRHRQYAALVLGLLIVLVLGGFFLLRGQQHTDVIVSNNTKQLDQQAQALADLRQMLETSIKGGSESKLTADYDAALRFIASKRGLSLAAFRVFLDQNATQALGDAAVSLKDKVRALQEAGKFVQARDFALEQARRLEAERHQSSKEEVELWTEAAKTELTLGHYDKALEYATKAVTQTDQKADFPTWSAARHQQGRALSYRRKDKEAQALYEELVALQLTNFSSDNLAVLQSRRLLAAISDDQGNYALAEEQNRPIVADCQRVLGAEHYETLASRNNLAAALNSQGKHAEAEQEHRAVLKIKERVLGAEHPDTLVSWNNLALTLNSQGKHAEAEQEDRARIKIEERVLGAEHPDTLLSRMGLANALYNQGKHAEAEQEYRAVLQIQERVLGVDHPDTLMSRMNLANALHAQGKHAEAEQEYRQMLKIRERVLGAEHPQVARSLYNLALCLEAQQKLPEALQFMQRAEQVWTKSLGPDHPHTKAAKADRERLEAALKSRTPQPGTAK